MAERKPQTLHYLGEETLQSRKHAWPARINEIQSMGPFWICVERQGGLRSTTTSLSLQILYDPLYHLHIPVYPCATE